MGSNVLFEQICASGACAQVYHEYVTCAPCAIIAKLKSEASNRSTQCGFVRMYVYFATYNNTIE